MWHDLPCDEKELYKKYILAFSSLTELFAQKKTDEEVPSPILNSKFQETTFCHVFNANGEDYGNTPYDASLILNAHTDNEQRFIIGIKTFGINAGAQKVFQMKKVSAEWDKKLGEIKELGTKLDKTEIDERYKDTYLNIAQEIAKTRNAALQSAEANLKGFSINDNVKVKAVYHFLMPSNPKKENGKLCIYVGEQPYDRIDVNSIVIEGCTSNKNPDNFEFSDGKHRYKYVRADSQLFMDFKNKDSVIEEWDVSYLNNPYSFLEMITNELRKQKGVHNQKIKRIKESHSWLLVDENGNPERFSGLNAFYGVGSKLGKDQRANIRNVMEAKFRGLVGAKELDNLISQLETYLGQSPKTYLDKLEKAKQRDCIVKSIEKYPIQIQDYILKKLYRPLKELYIPVPSSVRFHKLYPEFFVKKGIRFKPGIKHDLLGPLEERSFMFVFEPSGDQIEACIVQQGGKGIESTGSQEILGKWILEGIFGLPPYSPLTKRDLEKVGINAIRLYKYEQEECIHVEFIWINKDDPPEDFWQ